MAPRLVSIQLKRHEKVRANIDLPDVTAGTPGKVLTVTGVTWMRYRVLFDNGVEHGLLDGRHLVRAADFVPLDQRVEVVAAESNGAAVDGDDTETADATAGAENAFGVPAHLLERAKKARQRLAG